MRSTSPAPKQPGVIQVVGAIVAGSLAYNEMSWSAAVLALLFVIVGVHHLTETEMRRR